MGISKIFLGRLVVKRKLENTLFYKVCALFNKSTADVQDYSRYIFFVFIIGQSF